MSPGFFFESLVKEVSAPPGQPASFQFQLTNPGSEREIRVEPATLTQERNGSITYDPDADPSDSITFQTPTEFTVGSGQTFTIEGTINSVQEAGAQQYYGVFVYDQGRPVTVNQGGSSDARIQVNYVTRYLLRVELSVSGVAFENFDALTIQESGLRSRDGQAYAYAVLRNDLNAVVDLKLQAQLRKKEDRPLGRPFFLHLPVSASDPEPERYRSSILPGATVLLRRKVPEPVLPGTYQMDLSVLHENRTVKQDTLEVKVKEGQFPAQNNVVSRIVSDVTVKPSQIAFSRRPKGDRIQSIKVVNRSDQEINISLAAHERGDESKELSWLTYRPKSFPVPAGQSRSVFMSASGGSDQGHAYGFLEVTVDPTETLAGGKRKFPISFLSKDELNVSLETKKLQKNTVGSSPALTLPVKNTGNVHLNVRATMTIETDFGDDVKVDGGFGQWILPGDTGQVHFRLEKIPPEGSYPVQITLKPGHGQKPITLERTLDVK